MRRAHLGSAGLAALLVLTVVLTAAAVLRPAAAAVGSRGSVLAFLTAVLLLTAQTAAVATIVRTARARPVGARTWRTRILPVAARSLRLVGPGELLVAIVVDVPAGPLGTADRIAVRAVLWAALAFVFALVARRPRPAATHLAVLLVPPAALVLAAVLACALGASFVPGVALLTNPLIVSAIGALVVVPAVLVGSAVQGLQDTRDRGLRLARLIERRPRIVLVVLGTNLLALVLLVVVTSWASPRQVLLRPDARAWAAAAVIALVLVGTLTLDRRIGLDSDDHDAAGTLLTLVVAVPIAVVVLLATGLAAVSLLLNRPAILAGLVVLPCCVLVLRRRRLRPRLQTTLAVVVGALLSSVALVRVRALPAGARITRWEVGAVGGHGVALLAVLGGLAFVGAVLTAVLVGRARLLVYLGAVGLWTALVAGVDVWAGGGSLINIDLVLTLLLSVLAVLWITGRQQEVDGFEVVLTVVVTATLWLAPLVVSLAPSRLAPWLVVVALALPGLTAVWDRWKQLRRQEPGAGTDLARWCLSYALLAALVWLTGGSVASLPDSVSTALLAYVLLPLAMLLVVLSSAGRRRQEAPSPVGAEPQPETAG